MSRVGEGVAGWVAVRGFPDVGGLVAAEVVVKVGGLVGLAGMAGLAVGEVEGEVSAGGTAGWVEVGGLAGDGAEVGGLVGVAGLGESVAG